MATGIPNDNYLTNIWGSNLYVNSSFYKNAVYYGSARVPAAGPAYNIGLFTGFYRYNLYWSNTITFVGATANTIPVNLTGLTSTTYSNTNTVSVTHNIISVGTGGSITRATNDIPIQNGTIMSSNLYITGTGTAITIVGRTMFDITNETV